MSCEISSSNGQLVVSDPLEVLRAGHYSQLCYWGFHFNTEMKAYIAHPLDFHNALDKLLAYLSRHKIPFTVSQEVSAALEETERTKTEMSQAIQAGTRLKEGDTDAVQVSDFIKFLGSQISRQLKDHQVKAALHLIAVRNGANFSVPGSGKTTVVLSVFHWLRNRGDVDALFVVGPPSCFAPWQTEYKLVIGKDPACELLAGGNVEDRWGKYYVGKDDLCDLYLTTFQTLQRDWERAKLLLNQRGVRFMFVVDEAHYIKQIDGAWANAVLNVARYAKIRCILTGTPFPQSYADAFNCFEILWPGSSPLTQDDKIRIEHYIQKKKEVEAAQVLDTKIGPLFYRVRKKDLGLAQQDFCPPVMIQMNKNERYVYDAILDRIRDLSKEDYFRDIDLLLRLRRGRMMRLRQCLSYARLLGTCVSEYNEDLLNGKLSIADSIKHYDELESPAKIEKLLDIVAQLRKQGERAVIWSNFVETLKLIRQKLRDAGHGVELIYGETPTENTNVSDEMTREKIIARFVEPDTDLDLLVANPAACAESISLHKTCSHAIYYDLSYNCAQYLQSLDRIHRVGGSEHKIAHYHFLQYADTMDADILSTVQRKSQNMSAVIDQDYPIYSLDMFTPDEELEAYDRLFK